tara:strand:+ start:1112 stop:1363 length:252 start_codon:yes stop_codon:yes gene_type:complete
MKLTFDDVTETTVEDKETGVITISSRVVVQIDRCISKQLLSAMPSFYDTCKLQALHELFACFTDDCLSEEVKIHLKRKGLLKD